MRKIMILALIGFALLSAACKTTGMVDAEGAPPNPPDKVQPTRLVLPDDSPYVGTFSADRMRQGAGWNDPGTFTEDEYKKAFLGVRCGTRWLSAVTLSAKAGWSWNYHPEEGSRPEGYYLEPIEGDSK